MTSSHVYTWLVNVRPVPREDWSPVRTVRVSDELWEAAKRVAADRDETVTDVIIRALERYVRSHPLPEEC